LRPLPEQRSGRELLAPRDGAIRFQALQVLLAAKLRLDTYRRWGWRAVESGWLWARKSWK